jgi:hypothetical protein
LSEHDPVIQIMPVQRRRQRPSVAQKSKNLCLMHCFLYEYLFRLIQGLLWLPSQIGLLPVRLQAQKKTLPVLGASQPWGVNSVPLWLPSQKGWRLD